MRNVEAARGYERRQQACGELAKRFSV